MSVSSQTFVNLSGYRFVPLSDLPDLKQILKRKLSEIGVKGSILLASEGINVSLSGTAQQIADTRKLLLMDSRFHDIWFKTSESTTPPHRRLKVRIKAQIIAFDDAPSEQKPLELGTAANIQPQQLQQWLSEEKDFTLLDTRNDYEVESGTFEAAMALNIKHFRHFKAAVRSAVEQGALDPSKPLVTFCTGGIRCEKAAPWLKANGFSEVYQVEGGILHYLDNCGDAHWKGNCFVFDDRVELSAKLAPTGAGLCDHCQLAVPQGKTCECHLGYHYHATY